MPVFEWDSRCLGQSWEVTLFRACEARRAKLVDAPLPEQPRASCSRLPESAVFASALFAAFVAGSVCYKMFCASNSTTRITDDEQCQAASTTTSRCRNCHGKEKKGRGAANEGASSRAAQAPNSLPSSIDMPFAGGHDGGVRVSLDGTTVFKRFQHRHGRGAAEVSFLSHGARACGLDKHVPAFKGILIQPNNNDDDANADDNNDGDAGNYLHKFIPATDFDEATTTSRRKFGNGRRPGEVVNNASSAWIVMESATAGFRLPCYLDLKLSAGVPRAGSVSPSWPHSPLKKKEKETFVRPSAFDQRQRRVVDDASGVGTDDRLPHMPAPAMMSAARIAKKRQRARQTTLHAFGVKVVAGTLVRPLRPASHVQHFRSNDAQSSRATAPPRGCCRESFGLKYGRPCTQYSHLVDELRRFLVRPELRAQFRDAVATLHSKFSNASTFTFHGTSLLLAFDGGALNTRSCGGASRCCRGTSPVEPPLQLRWKLIDFANVHTHSTPVHDEGVLKGLSTLCRIADELVAETTE